MQGELFAILYSPWSMRARWALEDQGIDYRYHEFKLFVGEPLLRARMNKWSGQFTLPVFLSSEGQHLQDSMQIARWADHHGPGGLFPDLDAARSWGQRADALSSAGRLRTTSRVTQDKQASAESLPVKVDLGPLAAPLAKLGGAYLHHKYGDLGGSLEQMRQALRPLQDHLEAQSQDYLLGDRISWADIAMICALQFVQPSQRLRSGLGTASRRCWSEPELIEQFSQVLDWRDRLVEQAPSVLLRR